ncbi:MAG TPA: STAS domain-containing protein [Anaerolineales bacterium]|nr:STAS domain-containing protein [Anaerolineales bacterium]
MNITISKKQGRIPVTVMLLSGKLDGSNYVELIEEVRRLFQDGVRDLLIDLSQLAYMSSAGISAIHTSGLIFRGIPVDEQESGWASFHAIDRDRDKGLQKHVKLLSPLPDVAHVLDITGFKALFEIHTDLETAVASFQ